MSTRVGLGPLRALAAGHARVDAAAFRVQLALQNGLRGLLLEALHADEQSVFVVQAYAQDAGRWTEKAPSLWPWERRWFERRLPPAPARLLIGGAGGGREAAVLASEGYRIDCLEPVAFLAAACARRLGSSGEVVQGGYEDLASAVLDGAPGPVRRLAGRRYAAILLGWGSFSHVLRAQDQRRLVRACDQLAPHGPVLASFPTSLSAWGATERGRAEAAGRRLGRWLGALRGVEDGGGDTEYAPHTGFCHGFTGSELRRIAAAAGRSLAWDGRAGDYAHVTFRAAAEPRDV